MDIGLVIARKMLKTKVESGWLCGPRPYAQRSPRNETESNQGQELIAGDVVKTNGLWWLV